MNTLVFLPADSMYVFSNDTDRTLCCAQRQKINRTGQIKADGEEKEGKWWILSRFHPFKRTVTALLGLLKTAVSVKTKLTQLNTFGSSSAEKGSPLRHDYGPMVKDPLSQISDDDTLYICQQANLRRADAGLIVTNSTLVLLTFGTFTAASWIGIVESSKNLRLELHLGINKNHQKLWYSSM
jgi:hypothetical protein